MRKVTRLPLSSSDLIHCILVSVDDNSIVVVVVVFVVKKVRDNRLMWELQRLRILLADLNR